MKPQHFLFALFCLLLAGCEKDNIILPIPSDLKVEHISESSVRISWADLGHAETRFRVQQSTNDEPFSSIGEPLEDTTLIVEGIDLANQYQFRIQALHGKSESEYSDTLKLSAKLSANLIRSHDGLLAAFSPKGDLLAIGGIKDVQIIKVSDGSLVRLLAAPYVCFSIQFSADGKQLLMGGRGASWDPPRDRAGHFKIWNVSDGIEILSREMPDEVEVRSRISPDGSLVAVQTSIEGFEVFQISDGKVKFTADHQAKLWGLEFSPDGKLLVSTSSWSSSKNPNTRDNIIRIWNAENGTQVGSTTMVNSIVSYPPAFNKSGSLLFIASDIGIQIFDIIKRQVVEFIPVKTGALTVSPNNTYFAVGSYRDVIMYNLKTRKQIFKFTAQISIYNSFDEMRSVDFNSTESLVATGGASLKINVWALNKQWGEAK